MPNRHIKTINGRKYYYESIRKGKKVTSRYIGPVDGSRRKTKEEEELPAAAEPEEENYIG